MKASSGAFFYGSNIIPVPEANLPEVALDEILEQVRQHMSKLSGGFQLREADSVTFVISGNGWTVTFAKSSEAVS